MEVKLLNRDISWISFNNRVLDETLRNANTLADKIMFYGITHSNLSEFTCVRYPSTITELPDDSDELAQLTNAISENYDRLVKGFRSFNIKNGLIKRVRDIGKVNQNYLKI